MANDYTEETCKVACIANASCACLDYNLLDGTCFLGTSPASYLHENDAVHHWELTRCTATCVAQWTVMEGYHAVGLQLFGTAGALDELGCQSACLANSSCYNIDYNTQDRTCWLGFSPNPDIKQRPAINHWLLTRCAAQNSTDPEPECDTIWKQYPGAHSLNAVYIPQLKQLQQCMDSCDSMPACQGFDSSTVSQNEIQCWLHYSRDDFRQLYGGTAVSQYRLYRCPSALEICEPQFNRSQSGFYSEGGSLVSNVATLADCQRACQRKIVGCRGIDFFSDNKTCYSHTVNTQGKNLRARTASDQYTMTSACQTKCKPSWNMVEGTAGLGGQIAAIDLTGSSDIDLRLCLEFCWWNESCVGIEFSEGSQSPCSYYSRDQYNAMTQKQKRMGTNLYELTDRCSTRCDLSFVVRNNNRVTLYNSQVISSVTSSDQCANACRATYGCTVYQVSKSGTFVCTIAMDFVPSTDVTDSAYDTYIQQEGNCANDTEPVLPSPSPSPEGKCTAYWTLSAGRNTFGLVLQGTANSFTEDGCKDACFKNSSCNCADYNSRDLTCWHGTQRNPSTNPNYAVNHWDLTRICNNNCTFSWKLSTGMHALGLALNGQANQFTEDTCKISCETQISCRGVDYNRMDKTCWVATQSSTALYLNSQIDHWELTRTNC